ncbi:MAG: single-stranded DNA-binding protein [Geodermatophilaceae bacterium]|nr:single-stranded DNA-binding protein [Geodermatophilaceae bacterium]
MNGNTITVFGNLTKDPVLKYVPTGKAVINFSVACNHGWRDRESQTWVEGEASFFKVECWDALAENIAESFRKGDPLIVVGRMSCRKYEQEGQTRESWEIRADTVGPDMRKRSASLRRVLRNNHGTEPARDSDGSPSVADPDEESALDDSSLTSAPELAVAS